MWEVNSGNLDEVLEPKFIENEFVSLRSAEIIFLVSWSMSDLMSHDNIYKCKSRRLSIAEASIKLSNRELYDMSKTTMSIVGDLLTFSWKILRHHRLGAISLTNDSTSLEKNILCGIYRHLIFQSDKDNFRWYLGCFSGARRWRSMSPAHLYRGSILWALTISTWMSKYLHTTSLRLCVCVN